MDDEECISSMTNELTKRLSGQQVRQLMQALTRAFPNVDDLEKVTRFGLDKNLAEISVRNSLDDIVFDLIEWAEAQGRVIELVDAACSESPGNPELQSFKNDPRYASFQQAVQSPQVNSQQVGINSDRSASIDPPMRKLDYRPLSIWPWVTMGMVVVMVGLVVVSMPNIQRYLQRAAETPAISSNTPTIDTPTNTLMVTSTPLAAQLPIPTSTLQPTATAVVEPSPTPNAEVASASLASGLQALKEGDFLRAIEQCGLSIEADPLNAGAYYCRGFAYDHLHENENAILDYSEAIGLDPTLSAAYLGRGLLYANVLNECEKAIPDLEKYLETPGLLYEAEMRAALQRCQS